MNKITYLKYHRDSDYLENERLFRNIFGKRVEIIKKIIKKPGKVLDVGSSTGTMLDLFKENGWETFGVDPSASSEIAVKRGHKIMKGFFEKVHFSSKDFDVIVLNHTLEHLDHPRKIMTKVNNLLKIDGLVLVDVPNAGGLGAKILGSRWPYLLPQEHKHQFTKNSLSKVFIQSGFKVIHFESRSGIFEYVNPIIELWHSLTGFKKRFFTDLFTLPYAMVATAFNMGDSMSMVGRKI